MVVLHTSSCLHVRHSGTLTPFTKSFSQCVCVCVCEMLYPRFHVEVSWLLYARVVAPLPLTPTGPRAFFLLQFPMGESLLLQRKKNKGRLDVWNVWIIIAFTKKTVKFDNTEEEI